MSTIAIGDIHGHLRPLENLLSKLTLTLTSDDTVVFVGDYVDGGPDGRGCIDRILAFREESPAAVVTLKGNHEEWFLRTADDHTKHSWILSMEGLSTIGSYSKEVAEFIRAELKSKATELILDPTPLSYHKFIDLLPESHLGFFRSLELFHRGDGCIVVHAGVSEQYAGIEQETSRAILWGCPAFPHCYSGDDVIIYGHSPTETVDARGVPTIRTVGKTIGIDTINDGILTAIRFPEMEVIQSNRYGGRTR
jgi:serine/threonine protein phosphatase 1